MDSGSDSDQFEEWVQSEDDRAYNEFMLSQAPSASVTDALFGAAGSARETELEFLTYLNVWSGSGEWAEFGFLSPAAFLSNTLGVSHGDAARKIRLANGIAEWPPLLEALHEGGLSIGEAELMLGFASEPRFELFSRDLPMLIREAASLNFAHLRQALKHWASFADNEIASASPDENPGETPVSSRLHVAGTLDDRVELSGSFDAVDGVVIRAAIDAALRLKDPAVTDHETHETGDAKPTDDVPSDVPSDTRPESVRAGEALTIIASFFLKHHTQVTGSGNVVNLDVRIDLDQLISDDCGLVEVGTRNTLVDVREALALCCAPTITRVLMKGQSLVVDVGRATRAVSPTLEKAVRHRDLHCRFPGCGMPATFTDVHHVKWWSKNGETNRDNLVLMCRRHHRMLHHDWQLTGNPNEQLVFMNPNGRQFFTKPPSTIRARIKTGMDEAGLSKPG